MKKIIFWAIGIIGFLGFLAGSVSAPTSATPNNTAVEASTTTATPTPIYVVPPSTSAQIYEPPACSGSAICRDGSCSYSAHRQETCSHHGGVAKWL